MEEKTIQTFQEDCLDLLRQQTEGRTVNRRAFLSTLAVLGVSPALFRLAGPRGRHARRDQGDRRWFRPELR